MRKIGKVEPVQKLWLSSRETRDYLDCSEDFLQELREKAEIVYSIVGRKFFYELKSLERLIIRNKVV